MVFMRHLTRIRIATLSTALFLGGLTAAGLGFRATQDSAPMPVTARPRTEVIHETTTRTVHVGARGTKPTAAQPAPPAFHPRAPVEAAAKVRSRVSPTGSEHEGDEEGEGEALDD